ncbi:Transcription termination factor MTERF2, chloroplastic [Linum grandiflorum]
MTLLAPMAKSISFPPNQYPYLLNPPYNLHLLHPKILYRYKLHPSHLHHSIVHPKNRFPPKYCLNPTNPSSPTPTSVQQQGQEQNFDKMRDAQEAVSMFLQRFGVSPEDSSFIASNSPKYAKMLMESVEDLEEWSSWKTDDDGGEEFGELKDFKEKVVHMAEVKGDNGKVAFLESIGLNLSSSMNVARYLSKDSLPSLISKVKYMKDIFYSNSGNKLIFGKNARRMMMHLSIPIDEDLQQTLSFFEKIEARRGGLDMLGSSDASFRYLVESFPRILSLSVDSHLKPTVEFLESIGIPPNRMGNIFLLFPPTILWGVKGIRNRVKAFRRAGSADKNIGKVLVKYPWILSSGILDNYAEVISFFDMKKVPRGSVERASQSWPHILGCSTGKLKIMVEQFGELGVRDKKLGQVIATSPQLLLRKPSEFLQVVTFLKDIGFTEEAVETILCRCPEIFAASIDSTLRKKIESLVSIGIREEHLQRVIKKYPEILVSDFSRTVYPRMNYLMEMGITKKDVGFMVRRFSPLVGYSIEKVLKPKYEFLVETMEREVKDVVEYPRYFSYSLEKRIKPRYFMLKHLKLDCSLKDMLAKNDVQFMEEFMDAASSS